MGENSLLGALRLILRPFFEDMDGIWKYLKGICVGSLIVALSLWFFSYMASPEHFARAKRVLDLTGWFMMIVFFFSYLALYVEIFFVDKEQREERIRRIREFR